MLQRKASFVIRVDSLEEQALESCERWGDDVDLLETEDLPELQVLQSMHIVEVSEVRGATQGLCEGDAQLR